MAVGLIRPVVRSESWQPQHSVDRTHTASRCLYLAIREFQSPLPDFAAVAVRLSHFTSTYIVLAEGFTLHGIVGAFEGATPHRRSLRLVAGAHVVDVRVVGGAGVVEQNSTVYVSSNERNGRHCW